MKIRLNVRQIVEYLYLRGDLTTELMETSQMHEGTKIHQQIQSRYKEEDQAEVFFSYVYDYKGHEVKIQGRMDGLLNNGSIVEEIKSTSKDIDTIDEFTNPEHMAQAKFYAYMFLLNNKKKQVKVRLTYVHRESNEIKKITKRYQIKQLEKFFFESLDKYLDWYIQVIEQEIAFKIAAAKIDFPYEFRDNQRKFMGAVYQTLKENSTLYSIAPTGTGKTIATLFSAIKTFNVKDKIFYLTAKNSHKEIAKDTIELLNKQDLGCKTVEITSKDTICFLDKRDCDPKVCKYARGYFDRINDAIKDVYNNEDVFSRDIVEEYGEKHEVCPFEFSLALSSISEVIVCDYNYAFDPMVKLIRFFVDGNTNNKLLIDEAHNLVPRSLEMYSTSLEEDTLHELRKEVTSKKLITKIDKLLSYFDGVEIVSKEVDIDFISDFHIFYSYLQKYLEDHRDSSNYKKILEYFFMLMEFSRIESIYSVNHKYVYYPEDRKITLRCMDASIFIHEICNESAGTIFFSATLYPLDYYKELLTEGDGEYMIIPSPFPKENLDLIINDSLSLKYKDRERSFDDIVNIINDVTSYEGNYIVFCPSYEYLNKIKDNINGNVVYQERDMSLLNREKMVNQFREESNLTALFVLGGVFAEGVDYLGDMLSGVIVLGVGLPKISKHNELAKSFYQEKFNNGFKYAYTYPGINKVIQAVGRVIRSKTDKGIAMLIDTRYTTNTYLSLFPDEWKYYNVLNDKKFINIELNDFWRKNENNNR